MLSFYILLLSFNQLLILWIVGAWSLFLAALFGLLHEWWVKRNDGWEALLHARCLLTLSMIFSLRILCDETTFLPSKMNWQRIPFGLDSLCFPTIGKVCLGGYCRPPQNFILTVVSAHAFWLGFWSSKRWRGSSECLFWLAVVDCRLKNELDWSMKKNSQ